VSSDTNSEQPTSNALILAAPPAVVLALLKPVCDCGLAMTAHQVTKRSLGAPEWGRWRFDFWCSKFTRCFTTTYTRSFLRRGA